MKALINKLNKWANSNTTIYSDLLRVGIGVFFFFKGIQFADQTELIVQLIHPKDANIASMFIANYVVMAHFSGGILIAFGLLTRLACIVQLPIVVGAVLFHFMGETIDSVEFTQAILALACTVFFIVFGSGKHSVDYTLKLQL